MDLMRVSAKVDLDAILKNIEETKKRCENQKIYAVLKADGYGHGGLEIARELEMCDLIYGYAVATAEEAFELRDHDLKKPILILGYTFNDSYERVILEDIRPTIYTAAMAEEYADVAKKLGRKVYCHIKIDTGMSRIGYQVDEKSADEIASIFERSELVAEGIFTHFARSDEEDKTATDQQYELFLHMIQLLSQRGIHFTIRHCCNSAAAMEYNRDKLDAVRLGVTMYGMWPSAEVDHSFPIHPALSLYSHIVHIKKLPAGRSISYGGTYTTTKERVIATIPVGYADGYARSLSGKGEVLIRGKRAPIVGRICMDQMMVDVSDIPGVRVLDQVTLIGRDKDQCISFEELGELSGKFNYEFACGLGNRIPRLYYRNGRLVEKKQFF